MARGQYQSEESPDGRFDLHIHTSQRIVIWKAYVLLLFFAALITKFFWGLLIVAASMVMLIK